MWRVTIAIPSIKNGNANFEGFPIGFPMGGTHVFL